jgi:glutamine cyclotransferase
VKIIRRISQRPSFVQGLFFYGGRLYISSGLYGRSRLSSYTISGTSLAPAKSAEIPPRLFAEGAAAANGEVLVLTWREGALLRFGPETLELLGTDFYQGEGWGLSSDGERLFVTDGTDSVFFKDPTSFGEVSPPVKITSGGRAVSRLNELEWDPKEKLLLMNIWGSDLVIAADLRDGRAVYFLDLSPLRAEAEKARRPGGPPLDAANGLAIDEEGRLYATGKNWSLIFEIEAVRGGPE